MIKFWESPQVQGYGRLPMRSMLLPYPDEAAAQAEVLSGPEARDLSKNPWYRCLDGIWRFRLFPSPDEACSSPNWKGPDFDDHSWDAITVPGTWTRQGYDKPHYTNVQMPFDELPPHTPLDNPTAVYHRRFNLPESWNGRRVVLVLGSVESCHILFVNGQEVGGGKDSRLPSEYELTGFLHPGENTLALLVVRYSDASFVEDQDQWWFGGIHRSVYLYATGLSFIQDIEAQALPSVACAGPCVQGPGRLSLRVTLGFASPPPPNLGYQVAWTLHRLEAQVGAIAKSLVAVDADYHKNAYQIHMDQEVGTVDLWSHEHPALYCLTVSLSQGDKVVDVRACALGFRSVVVRDRKLLVNGAAVLIKGVNRHEHDQHTGKTVSIEAMVRDIKLLKSHHFNAVRTCHYPDDERWYELCDRYGIYLVDEANIEAHAFYDQLCRDPEWAQAFLERGRRMVLRDKNHASVIIWSLGNESSYGANHDLLAAWIRRCDPTRPLHYEGAVRPEWGQGPYTLDTLARGAQVSDIVAPMYPSIELISRYALDREDSRPLIMCEYSHAMGNSNGSLADYWEAIRTHEGLQGGFIWDWMDQGLAATDDTGLSYWKYGGDFGDMPTDYDFCLNGLLFPDQTPKPAMQECAFLFQPVALTYQGRLAGGGDGYVFELHNRYDFSTLDHLNLRWSLLAEGEVVAEASLACPSAAAGGKVPLVLNLPSVATSTSEMVLLVEFLSDAATAWTAAGTRVAWAEQVLSPGRKPSWKDSLPLRQENPLQNLGFSCLKPHLFRPPTENDGLKNFLHLTGNPLFTFYYKGKALYPWFELGLDTLVCSCLDPEDPDKMQISTRTGRVIGTFTREWSKLADGSLLVRLVLDVDKDLPQLARVGFSCRIPAAYEQVSWYGRGLHEAYPDRKAGAALGLYSLPLAQLEVPYLVPQEQGTRIDVRWLRLAGALAAPIKIEAESPFLFSVVRHEDAVVWRARHTCELDDTTKDGGYWILNLDLAQRGVGTASCGPDTLPQYEVPGGCYENTFHCIF